MEGVVKVVIMLERWGCKYTDGEQGLRIFIYFFFWLITY